MRRPPTRSPALLAVVGLLLASVAAARVNPGTESGVALTVPEPRQGFTVGILADRTTGYEAGLDVLERAVAELNLLEPELVFHIGDLVPGYTRDMDQWQRDIERVKAVLTRLEAPFYPTVGNHDVITGTGNLSDRRGEEFHKKYFGPLYYSVDHRGAHFVVLYTDEALESQPRIGAEQLEWLREDLSACSADQVFVLMHKPMWEYEGGGWQDVHRLLRQHPVRAVIAGHFHHYYKSEDRDGIQYYVLGVTGGRTFSPELAGGLEHYCLLQVRPDSYELALVKPGSVLPDDHVVAEDFKPMEKLRFLSPQESGPINAVRSPETGRVRERAVIAVTNPLDVPMTGTVRGRTSASGWHFRPESATFAIEPRGRQRVELELSSGRAEPGELRAPEVEIQYDYVDSRGRSVPIVLERRIPLRREAHLTLRREAVSVDGKADEEVWRAAPVLTTERWRTSPYESDEDGPTFRIVATRAGLYLYAESPDNRTSGFRADRMLSDAIFVGAIEGPGPAGGVAATQPPVVVLYPFEGSGRAVQAYWDPKRPVGVEAAGVYLAAQEDPDGRGWHCEAFVPWDLLLSETVVAPRQAMFNVGAWDNDGELFTELHSWAPTEDAARWGRLVVQPAGGP